MSLDIKSSVKKTFQLLAVDEPLSVFISQLFLGFVLLHVIAVLGPVGYIFGCAYLVVSCFHYFQPLSLYWFVGVELAFILIPTLFLHQLAAAWILSTAFVITLFADYLIELPQVKQASRLYKKEMTNLQSRHEKLVAQAQTLETRLALQHQELEQAKQKEEAFRLQLDRMNLEKVQLKEQLLAHNEGAILRQLREQFEDKKRELIQTRKSLFALEGELEETRKKFIDAQEHFDQRLFQEMKEHLKSNEEELELLKTERDKLEAIVSQFHK
jgi:hypothetical protein